MFSRFEYLIDSFRLNNCSFDVWNKNKIPFIQVISNQQENYSYYVQVKMKIEFESDNYIFNVLLLQVIRTLKN